MLFKILVLRGLQALEIQMQRSFRRILSKYLRMDEVKFFKGFLKQILLGSFMNTLTKIQHHTTQTLYRRFKLFSKSSLSDFFYFIY